MQISMLSYFRQLLFAIFFSLGLGIFAICTGVVSLSSKEVRMIEMRRNKIHLFFRMDAPSKVKSCGFVNRAKRIALDIAFGIISGVSISIFAYATGDGILRWFSMLMIVLGCFFATKYLHFPLQFMLQCGHTILQCFVQKIINLLNIPFYKIYRVLAQIFAPTSKKMLLLLRNFYGKIKYKPYKRTKQKKRVLLDKTERTRKLYYGRRNFEKN